MREVQADWVFPPEEDEPMPPAAAAEEDEEPMVPVKGAREEEGARGSSKSFRSALFGKYLCQQLSRCCRVGWKVSVYVD